MINYTQQATGRSFNTFTQPYTSNKIVLYITNLWIQGDFGYPVQMHITPSVINSSHYQWTATLWTQVRITRLQFSQIIFNQDEVANSLQYYIVYEEWINDNNGGFKSIPY